MENICRFIPNKSRMCPYESELYLCQRCSVPMRLQRPYVFFAYFQKENENLSKRVYEHGSSALNKQYMNKIPTEFMQRKEMSFGIAVCKVNI